MIEGVKVNELTVHGDDRGSLIELLRNDDKLIEKFGQATFSITYPGVIKAFHWHEKQDDLWFVVSGNAQVVLYDLREESPTSKKTQIIYLGELYGPKTVLIPKRVAHGYRVLGNKPVSLIYFTTEPYNSKNPDEKRIPFNDPEIGFDWATKNK